MPLRTRAVFERLRFAISKNIPPASCLIGVRHERHTLLARITQKAAAGLQLEVGTKVWVQIKSVALAEH